MSPSAKPEILQPYPSAKNPRDVLIVLSQSLHSTLGLISSLRKINWTSISFPHRLFPPKIISRSQPHQIPVLASVNFPVAERAGGLASFTARHIPVRVDGSRLKSGNRYQLCLSVAVRAFLQIRKRLGAHPLFPGIPLCSRPSNNRPAAFLPTR